MIKLPEILPQPKLPNHLSENAIWLAGEGAGSWFVIEKIEYYQISRYSSEGKLECKGDFTTTSTSFDRTNTFEISYPSHCLTVTILQNDKIIVFKRVLSS